MIRYAQGVQADTIREEVQLPSGGIFLDALAALYEAELEQVLNRGLHKVYRTKQGTEDHLRGRLDLQRQLQRQPPVPTSFECEYDELTHDTLINQAILYATTVLLRLVVDTSLQQALRRHQQRLRRRVTLRRITGNEIGQVQLNRLKEHYTDILRFTRLVLGNVHVSDIDAGTRSSFSFLVDMNTVFEKVVERAAQEAISNRNGWSVKAQDTSAELITGGKHSATLNPDVAVRGRSNKVQIVGDAKWKTGSPKNDDIYQIVAYQIGHQASGLLIYPEQGGSVASVSQTANEQRLQFVELPTATDFESFKEFEERMATELDSAVDNALKRT